jgi:hypothetical protein
MKMDSRLLLAGMTCFNGFPIENAGKDSLLDEFRFVKMEMGKGALVLLTRQPEALQCS